ncbi:hypothetical protein CEXT_437551 [Caerostris extrusa]|uniref:Uncharacterized protein n=1 Tax=Caerostris extrusa TaxID=172846 RepID=A0AAV4NQJ4_CAEEX|nr:hypothetical protein CEXT_437551 [Caerostris extrusa]
MIRIQILNSKDYFFNSITNKMRNIVAGIQSLSFILTLLKLARSLRYPVNHISGMAFLEETLHPQRRQTIMQIPGLPSPQEGLRNGAESTRRQAMKLKQS